MNAPVARMMASAAPPGARWLGEALAAALLHQDTAKPSSGSGGVQLFCQLLPRELFLDEATNCST